MQTTAIHIHANGGPEVLEVVNVFLGEPAPGELRLRQSAIGLMGSPAEFAAMIDFVASRRLVPLVHQVYPLDDIRTALGLMEKFAQTGKIVLKLV